MEIYLDNAAAVPCSPRTAERFASFLKEFPGNQESMGFHGNSVRRVLDQASEKTARSLTGMSDATLLWTNSGTEALIAGVEAVCRSRGGKGTIVTTPLEHPALDCALRRSAQRHSLSVEVCQASRRGIGPEQLEPLLNQDTAILAIHHVQSETGAVTDLKAVRELLDRKAPRALLLTDTMQSAGKLPLPWQEARIDFGFLSGQKLGAPCGAAVFCAREHAKVLLSLRSPEHLAGRCVPAAALTLADCVSGAVTDMSDHIRHAANLKETLFRELARNSLSFQKTVPDESASPYISHFLIPPYQGAILTRALYEHRISVAPGSACESETPGGSKALKAMGVSGKDSFCALRVSTWLENTPEEMTGFACALAECITRY